MPTTRMIGYLCKCGVPRAIPGTEIESVDEFEAFRNKKKRENWVVMHVHGLDGCGAGMWIRAGDLLILDIETEPPPEDSL
jgi:hypothetical protein